MNKDLISKDINNLLEAGIITEEEYGKIVERLQDYRNVKNVKTCKALLEEFENNLIDSGYSKRSIYRMYNDAKRYVEFVYKKNDRKHEIILNADFDPELFTTEIGRQYILYLLSSRETSTISAVATSYKIFVGFLNRHYYTGIDESAVNEVVKLARKKLSFEKSREIVSDSYFTEEDIYFMADLCEISNKLVVLLCYEACMTRDEISICEFTDIDFGKEVINVKDPESRAVCRTMPLPHDLCVCLKNYREELLELNAQYNITRAKKKQEPRPFTEYVFQSRKSGSATVTLITTRLTDIADKWYKIKYEETEKEISFEEFVKSSVPVTFPNIRFSKMSKMINDKKWTIDDIVYKYNLVSESYTSKRLSNIEI